MSESNCLFFLPVQSFCESCQSRMTKGIVPKTESMCIGDGFICWDRSEGWWWFGEGRGGGVLPAKCLKLGLHLQLLNLVSSFWITQLHGLQAAFSWNNPKFHETVLGMNISIFERKRKAKRRRKPIILRKQKKKKRIFFKRKKGKNSKT